MKANKLTLVMAILAIMFIAPAKAKAQVNAQLFYDFGSDREFVTLTLEMFKQDKWGNTYFFIDHVYVLQSLNSREGFANALHFQ